MIRSEAGKPRLRGLYVLADASLGALAADRLSAALRGGARLVQYRDKERVGSSAEVAALRALCRHYSVPFVVNDDVALALDIEADGVHLGRDDESLAMARARLGPAAIIGVSCYNELGRAEAAARDGADYVAFGSFFASTTKPDAVPASLSLLKKARRALRLPIIAIGGITPQNGAPLCAAGADMLAVAAGIFKAPDPEAAARAYMMLFGEE